MPRRFENMSIAQLEAKSRELNNPQVPLLMMLRNEVLQELNIKRQEEAARIARENQEREQREALRQAEEERKAQELEELNLRTVTIESLISELVDKKKQLGNSLELLRERTASILLLNENLKRHGAKAKNKCVKLQTLVEEYHRLKVIEQQINTRLQIDSNAKVSQDQHTETTSDDILVEGESTLAKENDGKIIESQHLYNTSEHEIETIKDLLISNPYATQVYEEGFLQLDQLLNKIQAALSDINRHIALSDELLEKNTSLLAHYQSMALKIKDKIIDVKQDNNRLTNAIHTLTRRYYREEEQARLLDQFSFVNNNKNPSANTLIDDRIQTIGRSSRAFIADHFHLKKAIHSDSQLVLTVDAYDIEHLTKPLVFIDAQTKQEVGRFYLKNNIIYFKGYGQNITLSIKGQLCNSDYQFDNNDAELTLNADIHQEDNLSLIVHAKSLALRGEVEAKGYIDIKTNGNMILDPSLRITSEDQLKMDAKTINSAANIQSVNCHLAADESLENHGCMITKNQINILGKDVQNFGEIAAENLYLGLTGSLINEGNIHGKDGIVVVEDVIQNAQCDFDLLQVTTRSFKLGESSVTSVNKLLNVVSEENHLQGKLNAENVIVDGETVAFAGSLEVQKAYLNASRGIIFDGVIHNRDESDVSPELTATAPHIRYSEKSQIRFKNGTLSTHAKIIEDQGQKEAKSEAIQAKRYLGLSKTHVNQLFVDATHATFAYQYDIDDSPEQQPSLIINADQLDFQDTNSLNCAGEACIEAENVSISGKTNCHLLRMNSNAIELNNVLNCQQATLAADHIVVNANINCLQSNSDTNPSVALVHAKTIQIGDHASINVPTGQFIAECEDQFMNKGNIEAKRAAFKANTIQQNGTLVIEQCYEEANNTLSQSGLIRFQNAYLNAPQMELSGIVEQNSEIKTQVTKDQPADQLVIKAHATHISADANLEQALIESEEVNFDATANVNGYLFIKSDHYHMSPQSEITGNGLFGLQSHDAELSHIQINDIDLSLDHLPIVDALTHRGIFSGVTSHNSLSLATNDDVNFTSPLEVPFNTHIKAATISIAAPIHSDKSLSLEATVGNIHINPTQVAANDYLAFDAKNAWVNQGGNIKGGQGLYIHSFNQCLNQGGIIQSPLYVQLLTEQGDIINQATQHPIQGEFDTLQSYIPGQILGGTGNEQGYGAFLKTPGKMINDGSSIQSQSSNYIEAGGGIEDTPRYNQYLSYYRKYENLFRKAITKEYSWQLQQPVVCSINGKNDLISPNGYVDFLSLKLFGKEGNFVSANQDITFNGLKLEKSCDKKSSQFANLIRDHRRERVDINVPVEAVTLKDTYIISLNDVKILNALIISPGELFIKGRNVTLASPILHYGYQQDSRGFGVSLPGLECIPGYAIVNEAQSIKTAKNSNQRLAAIWNTSLDTLNVLNDAVSAFKSRSFVALFNPTIEFSYADSHVSMEQDFLPDNVGVEAGNLTIEADDEVKFIQGINVRVADSAKLTAQQFTQEGAELHAKQSYDSKAVTLGLSLMDKPNVGVKFAHSKGKQTTYENQLFQVGNSLKTHLKGWDLKAANTIAGTLSGNVDQLTITSPLSTTESESISASADTGKNFSFNHAKEKSAKLNQRSGIEILDQDSADNFVYVKTTELQGGEINAGANFTTDYLINKPVKEYEQNNRIGIFANLRDLTGGSEKLIPTATLQINDIQLKVPLPRDASAKLKCGVKMDDTREEAQKDKKHDQQRNSNSDQKNEHNEQDQRFIEETQAIIDEADTVAHMPIQLDTTIVYQREAAVADSYTIAHEPETAPAELPSTETKATETHIGSYTPIDNENVYDLKYLLSAIPTLFNPNKICRWENQPQVTSHIWPQTTFGDDPKVTVVIWDSHGKIDSNFSLTGHLSVIVTKNGIDTSYSFSDHGCDTGPAMDYITNQVERDGYAFKLKLSQKQIQDIANYFEINFTKSSGQYCSGENYKLFRNNCTAPLQKALEEAGIKLSPVKKNNEWQSKEMGLDLRAAELSCPPYYVAPLEHEQCKSMQIAARMAKRWFFREALDHHAEIIAPPVSVGLALWENNLADKNSVIHFVGLSKPVTVPIMQNDLANNPWRSNTNRKIYLRDPNLKNEIDNQLYSLRR